MSIVRPLLVAIVAMIAVREAPAQVPAGALTIPPPDREVAFWQSIQDSSNLADFDAYLREFPDGFFVPFARSRIAVLQGLDNFDMLAPRPTWTRNASGQAVLVIEGAVKNLADLRRPVPHLRVILRDHDVEIWSRTFAAAAAEIEAHGEVSFRTEITAPPPATAVVVVFAPAEAPR
jgi:hypothetical protein